MMDSKLKSASPGLSDDELDLAKHSSIQVFTPFPNDPTYVGTSKADIFNIPAASFNLVFGLGGNDTIKSNGGNNFIYSDDFTSQISGNDKITISSGTSSNYNYINTGNGNDTVTISGSSTNFIVTGNGTQSIISGNGPTTVDIGPGNKTVSLGSGNDSILYNVPLNGSSKDSFDGGSGNNTLYLAFSTTAQLAKFQSVLGSEIINNFGNFDMQKAFDFSKYESQLGFNLGLKAVHFQNLVLDVNPTAQAYTTTVNLGPTNIPSTPFLLTNDTGYQGHTLSLSSISTLTSSSNFLKVTADYVAFAPTIGNPSVGEFATFDLIPSGSSAHATLILYNNGSYEIQNASVLNSVIQEHPDIQLNFTYTDSDGFGGHASNTAQINFNFVATHDIITAISSPVPQAAQEGSAFSMTNDQIFAGLFTQTENDTFSLSVSNLPAGLSYSAENGITGTPTVETSTYLVSVTATNTDPTESTHSTATNTLTLNIADALDIITFNGSIATQSLTEGILFDLATATFFSHTETDDPLTYSATGLAGSGLSINPTTGAMTGTPDDPNIGSYLVTVTATNTDPFNGGEHASSNTFTINVADAANEVFVNAPLSLTNTGGDVVSTSVASLFSSEDAVSYYVDPNSAVQLSALGLSLNSATGLITGTVTASAGSYVVTIDAHNLDPANAADPDVSNTVTFGVNNADPVTQNSSFSTLENHTYTLLTSDFNVTDPNVNDTLSILLQSTPTNGTLFNNGVALNSGDSFSLAAVSQGLITFTPTQNDPFDTSFTYIAEDNHGGSSAPTIVSIDVTPVLLAPSFVINSVTVDDQTHDLTINLTATLVNLDGSESITISSDAAPAGVLLSPTSATDPGDTGSITQSFIIDPQTGFNSPYAITLHAVATENATNNTATTDLHIIVGSDHVFGTADILMQQPSSPTSLGYVTLDGTQITGSVSLPDISFFGNVVENIGDFNGDGKADVLLSNSHDFTNLTLVTFNGPNISSVNSLPDVSTFGDDILGLADSNGDGKADILMNQSGSLADLTIVTFNGTSLSNVYSLPDLSLFGNTILGFADFNADGNADVLLCNSATPTDLTVVTLNGASISSVLSLGDFSLFGTAVVGFGDLTGDGNADVVLSQAGSPTDFQILSFNGSALSSVQDLADLSSFGTAIAGVGDFVGKGSSGTDTLTALSGENVLVGEGGNDTLVAGTGVDLFLLSLLDMGNEVIQSITVGQDTLQFSGAGSFSNLDNAGHNFGDDGNGNLMISFVQGGALTLEGISSANIHSFTELVNAGIHVVAS